MSQKYHCFQAFRFLPPLWIRPPSESTTLRNIVCYSLDCGFLMQRKDHSDFWAQKVFDWQVHMADSFHPSNLVSYNIVCKPGALQRQVALQGAFVKISDFVKFTGSRTGISKEQVRLRKSNPLENRQKSGLF